jgi:hypothetical protein
MNFTRKGEKEARGRLQRHPLIDSIFFWSPRMSTSLAGRNLHLVTSSQDEAQPLFLPYSDVNSCNHTTSHEHVKENGKKNKEIVMRN